MEKGIALTDRRDLEIIELYWKRDEQAIVRTEESYGPYCKTIAVHIVQDEEDAKECCNDTWLRAWNTMPPKRPSLLSAYLGRITRNLAIDCYRKKHAKKTVVMEMKVVYDELRDCVKTDGPEEHLEVMVLTEVINRFLAELDEEARNVFVKRYWYVRSIREIADECRIKEGTVKVMLSRLRNRLRGYLEKEGIPI